MEAQVQQHGIKQPQANEAEGVTGSVVFAKLKEQDGCCFYTGDELTFDNVSLEHTIPLCREGRDVRSNITLVTKQIQYAKGRMTGEEFIEMCRAVVRTHG